MTAWRGTFYDRITRDGLLMLPPWFTVMTPEIRAMLKNTTEVLKHAEVFDASNVAEYLYAGTDQEHWGGDDFPCVAPPYPVMFIEWGRPSRIISEIEGEVDPFSCVAAHTGVLLAAVERDDGEPGWQLGGTVLIEVDERDPIARNLNRPGVLWSGVGLGATVNADGSIENISYPYAAAPKGLDPKWHKAIDAWATATMSGSWPAFLALTFANCRNVARETVEPPSRIVKRDTKKGKPPRVSYHVLDIGPIKTTLRREGGLGEQHGSLQRALHTCRGHFKSYTDEAPLFGRISGTWWWHQHLRGTAKAGVVQKDYNVKSTEGGT